MQAMDPDNAIVRLCRAGIEAEGAGRPDDARALYEQAWAEHQTDFEACIAAHYLARQQGDPHAVLRWNVEAIERAMASGDERTFGFYPSLYLNLGWSFEMIGDQASARTNYLLAEAYLDRLGTGRYRDLVGEGVANGLRRTAEQAE